MAFRRSAPVVPGGAGSEWRPELVSDQLRVMEELTAGQVAVIGPAILARGSARLAILGAGALTVRRWIGASVWASIAPLAPARAAAACPPTPANRVSTPAGAPNPSLYFSICIPEGGPLSVPPAVLLASAMLGNREDAILAKRLRGETGLAYSFENRIVPTIDGRATLWFLHIGTQNQTVETAIAEVRGVLGRVSRGGVTEATVADFRTWYSAQRSGRGLDGRTWVTTLVTSGASPEQEAARASSVTIVEITAALRHWAPERLVIVAPPP